MKTQVLIVFGQQHDSETKQYSYEDIVPTGLIR